MMRRPTQNLGNCIKDLKTVTCSMMKDERLTIGKRRSGNRRRAKQLIRNHELYTGKAKRYLLPNLSHHNKDEEV
jgi:hypothetical protein